MDKKWVVIQPSHYDCRKISKDAKWSNDSFNNISRLFEAQLFHIKNDNIDETADIYWLINFDINLIEKEHAFLKKMKEKGKKIIVGFSQDRRFIMGQELISDEGTHFSKLCELADVIGGGINPNLKVFGRYQKKVVPFGEILENVNLSTNYENRYIDFMVSGEKNGDTLAFEIELLLMIKEEFPEKIIACCIPNEVKLKEKLKKQYSNKILFLDSITPFLEWLKVSKYYCNMEIRPRSGRCMMEAYYCKIPYISSAYSYHSNLFYEFSYTSYDLIDIFDKYKSMISFDYNHILDVMEIRAKEDKFEAVHKRIMEKLYGN